MICRIIDPGLFCFFTSPERDSNSQRLVVIGTDCIGSNNDEYTVYTDIFNIIPSYIRIPSRKNNKIYIYFSESWTGPTGKVYQFRAHGRWFSPGSPASSTTTTGRHDIAAILLKVALNTKNHIKSTIFQFYHDG
jgi:hypothetical protein